MSDQEELLGATDESPVPRPAPMGWRERIAVLFGIELTPVRVAAVGVLAVGAAVAGWAVLRPPPTPPAPELALPVASSSTVTTVPPPAEIVVHGSGALAAPGVYRLAPDARVADLVAAAGGPAADADMSGVNLAAPLADGQRLYVPRVGETPPAEVVPSGGGGSGGAGGSETPPTPVNVNRATAAELEALPGVGPATAAAIIAYREEHGGFGRIDELLEVRGIGPARYEQLRSLVTV